MSKSRVEILESLKNKEYDLTVIGGGVIGGSIAYVAARTGIKVLVIEKYDFSFGASSRTNKIIAGAFGDIKNINFSSLVRLLKERRRISKKISATPFGIFSPAYDYKGLTLGSQKIKAFYYELASLLTPPSFHLTYNKKNTINYFPSLVDNDLVGSVKYYESSIDDARYTIKLLLNAERFGADILNYTELTAFDYNSKNINRLLIADTHTRRVYEVNTKNTVVAAGAWTKDISDLIPNCRFKNKIKYVKGTQIFLNAKSINIKDALILPPTHKKSNLYIIPWKEDTVVIGSTMKNYNRVNDCIYSTSDEIEYILDVYNIYFNATLNEHSVISTQSGMYPTDKVSFNIQKHPVYNYYALDGGSFTMSGHIAHKTLKAIFPNIFRWKRTDTVMHKWYDSDINWVLKGETLNFFLSYYGYIDIALRVNKIAKEDASLLENVAFDDRLPKALIHYFVKCEHALHLTDIMSRRLRFLLTENDCATLLAEQVAEEMALILNWTNKQKETEIKKYRTEIKRSRISLF